MPEVTLTKRGEATRRRILDVAITEFADRGLAGARIDRITENAATNKAQLYAYFGSKDGLFDAVMADSVEQVASALPFNALDLAGWAVRMYDEYLAHPELVRLATWYRLEKNSTGQLFGHGDQTEKIAAIKKAQRAGVVKRGNPEYFLTMITSMATAWSPVSANYVATNDESKLQHTNRRKLLRETVDRIVAP